MPHRALLDVGRAALDEEFASHLCARVFLMEQDEDVVVTA